MPSHSTSPILPARLKRRLLSLSRRLVGIPSTESNMKIARFVEGELSRLGFRVTTQRGRLDGKPQLNLIARKGPKKGCPLLFNTHLDTVKTDPKLWTKTGGDPFRLTIRGGNLYGLGAADTKLALACQCVALESLGEVKFKRPLMITATYGEERGLMGVQALVRHPWIHPADVLNSEPSELKPVNGNYGFRVYSIEGVAKEFETRDGFVFEILFQGKAAHSAYPSHGINAIVEVLRWLQKEKSAQLLSMEGGVAPNVVPSSCVVRVLTPKKHLVGLAAHKAKVLRRGFVKRRKIGVGISELLISFLNELSRRRSSSESFNLGVLRWKGNRFQMIMDHRFAPLQDPFPSFRRWRRFFRACRLSVLKDNPPWCEGAQSPLMKEAKSVLKSIGRKAAAAMKLGCTEAGFFARRGCEVLTFGPGAARGNAHQPNESVPLKELEAAVVFYREMIRRLCL